MGDYSVSLDVKELQRREDAELTLADIAVRGLYAKKVRNALERLHHKKKRENEQLAEDLLTGKTSVEDILQNNDGEWHGVIRNSCKEYSGLCDLSFLLLYAPRSATTEDDLPLDLDKEARIIQLNHFFNVLTYRKDKEKCPKETQMVKTYRNLKMWMDNFFETRAFQSKRAVIVFNGHGKESGHLTLENETENISNTTFINDVYDCWKEAKKERLQKNDCAVVLPEKITVVLAHCYGYRHEQDPNQKDMVEVACLTSPDNETTKFAYKLNTIGRKVKESVHIELINYAREQSVDGDAQVDETPHAPPTERCGIQENRCITREKLEKKYPDSTHSVLDIMPFACLAFSQGIGDNKEAESGVSSSEGRRRSSTDIFCGITNVKLDIQTKRISQYFTKKKGSTKQSIVAAGICLAHAPLAMIETDLPVSGKKSKTKEKALKTKDALKTVSNLASGFMRMGVDGGDTDVNQNELETGKCDASEDNSVANGAASTTSTPSHGGARPKEKVSSSSRLKIGKKSSKTPKSSKGKVTGEAKSALAGSGQMFAGFFQAMGSTCTKDECIKEPGASVMKTDYSHDLPQEELKKDDPSNKELKIRRDHSSDDEIESTDV